MRVAILDDEAVYAEKMKELLKSHFPDMLIDIYQRGGYLINTKQAYDLLLLDIEMPDSNGITFAKQYSSLFDHIIFITSHDECVFDAFLPNVRGFVVKDQTEEKLIATIHRVIEEAKKTLSFSTDIGNITIREDQIQYFYTEDTFIYLITMKQRYSLTYKSLKQLSLNADKFMYINRHHVINLTNVCNIQKAKNSVRMMNGDVIKVSRRKWKALITAYTKGCS